MVENQTLCDTRTQDSLTEKKRSRLRLMLVFACWLVYTASMITKMIYSVELVEIIGALGITTAQGGFPLTCYYITYGISQVVFALCIRRVKLRPFFVISVGASAVVMMLGAVFASLPGLMVIFAVIGILQCCTWGAHLHLITLYVRPEKQAFSVGFLCTGYSVGNLLAYLMSFVSMAIGSWKYAFLFAGGFLLLTLVFFFIIVGKVEKEIPKNVHGTDAPKPAEGEKSKQKPRRKNSFGCAVYLTVCVIGSLVSTALYTAGANYLPVLLFDVHGVSTKYSVLISTLMPVFVTVGPFLLTAACTRRGSFMRRSAIFLIVSAAAPLLLLFVHDSSILWSVLLSALYAMMIRGVATGYISVAPLHMDDEMDAGSFSAIANAGGTVAAAGTPVVFGWMLDTLGWPISYGALAVLTLLLAVLHIGTQLVMRRMNKTGKRKK